MNQGGHHRGVQHNTVGSFLERLRNQLGNDLSKLEDKEIFHPRDGYASKIVEELSLKGVQLRRFYTEIRNIYERFLEGKGEKELRYNLYKLYAVTQYQENRNVIRKDFGNLVRGILDSLDRNFTADSLRKASDFFMAMVAYSKRES